MSKFLKHGGIIFLLIVLIDCCLLLILTQFPASAINDLNSGLADQTSDLRASQFTAPIKQFDPIILPAPKLDIIQPLPIIEPIVEEAPAQEPVTAAPDQEPVDEQPPDESAVGALPTTNELPAEPAAEEPEAPAPAIDEPPAIDESQTSSPTAESPAVEPITAPATAPPVEQKPPAQIQPPAEQPRAAVKPETAVQNPAPPDAAPASTAADEPSIAEATAADDYSNQLSERIQAISRQIKFSIINFHNQTLKPLNEQFGWPLLLLLSLFSAAAVVSAAASLSAGVLAGSGFLIYLHYFLSQPILLLGRKKRNNWGLVYNSITKQPIYLAIVRVFNQADNKLAATRVTDKQGRFNLIMEPGKYYLEAGNADYRFPSEILIGQQQDNKFLDLYQGGAVNASADTALNYNIPVDPAKKIKNYDSEIKDKNWRGLKYAIAAAGPLASLISLIISPQLLVAGLLVVQFFLFFMFKEMAMPPKLKNWGVAAGGKKHQPLKNAIIRIFDTRYNRLLETQITDRQGRYGFLVTPNTYQLTGDKPGYTHYTSRPITIKTETGGLIKPNIKLRAVAD